MNTSQRASILSEIESDEPLSVRALAYLRQKTRMSFYDFVLKKFLEAETNNGLRQSDIVRRTGMRSDVLSRNLASPGNWTLDTITDLLIGISREEAELTSIPLLGRVSANRSQHDDVFPADTASSNSGTGGLTLTNRYPQRETSQILDSTN